MKTGRRDGAVEDDAEVEFAGDGKSLFDQQAAHLLALGTGLVGHQLHAENFSGQFSGFVVALGQFHAAALATASGVDLRLDYHSGGSCAQ